MKEGTGTVATTGQPGELVSAADHLRSVVRLEVRHRALMDSLRKIHALAHQGEETIAVLVDEAIRMDALLNCYHVEQMVQGRHLTQEEWLGARDKQGPPYVISAEDYHAPPANKALEELLTAPPAPEPPPAPDIEFPEVEDE